MELLSSNVSLSAAARMLRVNPKTVAKKLLFLGAICEERNQKNALNYRSVDHIQFDELPTIEHHKCKPCRWRWRCQKMSVRFWGSSVIHASHWAFGQNFTQKYEIRPDHRKAGLTDLFNDLSLLSPTITISSDECSFYNGVVRQVFSKGDCESTHGEKSSVAGQGELKKTRFDPIFSINHTFAMLRPMLVA